MGNGGTVLGTLKPYGGTSILENPHGNHYPLLFLYATTAFSAQMNYGYTDYLGNIRLLLGGGVLRWLD